MEDNIYRHKKEEMILRDFLATDRTILANERTFLAYIRTGLSILVSGISFISFIESIIIRILGYCFLPLGVGVVIIGIYRYLKVCKRTDKIRY